MPCKRLCSNFHRRRRRVPCVPLFVYDVQPQGTWMGWIQTFGSLGRVTFPLITKIFSVPFAFFLSSLGCGIAILALLIYMKLVKMTM